MIIWGSRGKTIDLGEFETRHCPICEKERKFKHFVQYRYGHLYYIFGFLTKKQHLIVCEACNRGPAVDSKSIESKMTKNPIPFLHRMGWTILVGLIVVVIICGNLAK
jgi:hypothetical protein